MKTKIFVLLVFLFLSLSQTAKPQETCTLTYIANEGFLIETGNHKVLIDALFGDIQGNWCAQPGDSLLQSMIDGIPPFDNIDVVLVTHKHPDHFNESMTVNFLKNHPKSILICPNQANELLRKNNCYQIVSDRINTLNSVNPTDTVFNLNEINIRALRFNHSAYMVTDSVTGKTYNRHMDIENIGYVIEINGFFIFHSGDDSPSNTAQYSGYKISDKEFDVVFLNRMFLGRDGLDLIDKYIHAKNLIFMHVEPDKIMYYKSAIQSIPEMFVFGRITEQKVIKKENSY